jgi:hypothetical protein
VNEQQIKIRIYIILTLDWLIIVALLVGLFIAHQNETKEIYMVIAGLAGLGIIHQIGTLSVNKIHTLRTNLKNLEHERKQKEIQDLMSKGGQKVKKS